MLYYNTLLNQIPSPHLFEPTERLDAFRGDTAALWRDVLRRQPGELAWHSTRPVDPELN